MRDKYSTATVDVQSIDCESIDAYSSANDGIRIEDFYAYLPTHHYFHVPTGAMWAAISVNAKIEYIHDVGGKPIKPTDWLDQYRCAVQLTWMPGEALEIRDKIISDGGWIDHAGVTCLNMYKPPTIVPGDADGAGPWIDHVRKVYPDDADRLFQWFAHRVQFPGVKINHALLLGGSPGIGKDSLIAPVIQAVGPWNCQDIAPKAMLAQFNTFARSVILRISETRDLGDVNRYTFYDASKVYCASPPEFLRVNQKHMQEFYIPNVCGVIYTSNYRTDALFLPPDDRRHDVLWSDLTAADFPVGYWTGLWKWYASGGFENVAAYLKDLDISEFDPAAPPPKGPAFWAIVDAGAAPEDAEFADVLDLIGSPPAVSLFRIKASANGEIRDWLSDRKNRRAIPHRFEKCGYVPVRNTDTKQGLWIVNEIRQVIYAKVTLSVRDRQLAAMELVRQSGKS
jgi:hypothetical protein